MVRTIWANCSLQILLILKKKSPSYCFGWLCIWLRWCNEPLALQEAQHELPRLCVWWAECRVRLLVLSSGWSAGGTQVLSTQVLSGLRVMVTGLITLLTYTQLLVSNHRRMRLIYSISFPNSGPNSWRVDISAVIYLPGAGHNRQGHLAEVISGFLQLSQLHHWREDFRLSAMKNL